MQSYLDYSLRIISENIVAPIGDKGKGKYMLSIEHFKVSAHKANAIDKRAINELKYSLLSDIKTYNLTENYGITANKVIDESNYIIVEVEGYENIAFIDEENYVYEKVQPIDRKENKLYPMQMIEVEAQYKRYH